MNIRCRIFSTVLCLFAVVLLTSPSANAQTGAASLTGIVSDARNIAITLHRHGALSFWDYAAAAPYVDINMGPVEPPASGAHGPGGDDDDTHLSYKDAIFISPHKFIGGPGTPGLLDPQQQGVLIAIDPQLDDALGIA